MGLIFSAIKILIISILAIFYYPLNTAFLTLQVHYRKWQKEDRVSYIIATPLYYFLFVICAILGFPIESMGEAFHPGLRGFQ